MDSASIIIPTKNAGSGFDQMLESLRSQDFPDIEIIVIDSGSTDQTVPIANRLADTVIEISPSDFHHGRTRNQGAANASNDILVFTVQDACPVDRKWLTNLVSPIESGDADLTYGNQVAYPDAKPIDEFSYQYFYPDTPIELSKEDTRDESQFYMENIFLSDVTSAISREVWEGIQFRESVGMSEDKDFAYRAASAGFRIRYCPEAKIYHSHDYTLRSLFERRYKDGKAFANIASPESDSFVSDGIRYVLTEYSYLVKSGAVQWIPYALLYDAIYFISFTLGKNHERLPDPVKKRIEG